MRTSGNECCRLATMGKPRLLPQQYSLAALMLLVGLSAVLFALPRALQIAIGLGVALALSLLAFAGCIHALGKWLGKE